MEFFLIRQNQTQLPVFYDEEVHRIVADITQQKKDELSKTILLLGAFHMAKTAQHSIAMLIKNTGCLSGDWGFWCQYN